MNARAFWLPLLALHLVALPVLADPPVAVDPSLTEPADLHYQFALGQEDRYRMTINQEMTMTGAGVGGSMATSVVMTLETAQVVTAVDEAGNGTVQQTMSSPTMTMTMNGQEVPLDGALDVLNGLAITVQMSPRGQVLDTEVGAVPDPQMQAMLSMMEDSFTQMALQFPEGPLAIGQTWTQAIPMDMEQPGMDFSTEATANYTFLGYAPVNGQNVAVVQGDMSMTISGTATQQGVTATATGTGSGTGYTYFDQVNGKVLSGTMDMVMTMAISAQGVTTDQNMTMRMSIDKI